MLSVWQEGAWASHSHSPQSCSCSQTSAEDSLHAWQCQVWEDFLSLDRLTNSFLLSDIVLCVLSISGESSWWEIASLKRRRTLLLRFESKTYFSQMIDASHSFIESVCVAGVCWWKHWRKQWSHCSRALCSSYVRVHSEWLLRRKETVHGYSIVPSWVCRRGV